MKKSEMQAELKAEEARLRSLHKQAASLDDGTDIDFIQGCLEDMLITLDEIQAELESAW